MNATVRRLAAWKVLVWWLLSCAFAGALGGVGLIESNWGGPPYDGGFLGYLFLFGGFLAAGQLPFVIPFFTRLSPLAGLGPALGWVPVGFLGWGAGSVLRTLALPTAYSPTDPSLPLWLLVGMGQAALLLAVVAGAPGRRAGEGGVQAPAGGAVRAEASSSAGGLVLCGAWAVACTVGGVLLETLPYVLRGPDGSVRLDVAGLSEVFLEGWGSPRTWLRS